MIHIEQKRGRWLGDQVTRATEYLRRALGLRSDSPALATINQAFMAMLRTGHQNGYWEAIDDTLLHDEKSMITVAILINGKPIMARSATNTGEQNQADEDVYAVDDGSTIAHDPDDDAVALAQKLLNTIIEQGVQ